MRAGGIRHSAPVRLNSSHAAQRSSPGRTNVSGQELQGKLRRSVAAVACDRTHQFAQPAGIDDRGAVATND